MIERALINFRKIVENIVNAIIVVMTLIICWQVFSRFVLGETPSWVLELSLLLMVWAGFIGIAMGIQDNSHIQITLFVKMLPEKVRRIMDKSNRILAMLFGLFLVIEGSKFANSMRTSFIPGLKIPSSILYLAVPVAGVLIVIYLLCELFGKWTPGSGLIEEEE
jgi:TRAP-type C4-dicarboxylate transport system permease small subunit